MATNLLFPARAAGDTNNWHLPLRTDLTAIRDVADAAVPAANMDVILAKKYGVVGDGTTNDTAALQLAIAAIGSPGGCVQLGAGTFLVDGPLVLSHVASKLRGVGHGATIIRPATTFSGASVISITANDCGVEDLSISYASSTVASNPAANAVTVTAARQARINRVSFQYINGWCAEIAGTSSLSCFGAQLNALHGVNVAKGIYIHADTAQSFGAQCYLSNINMEIVLTGDCILIEDAADVNIVNINGAAGQNAATNSMIHVKGASNSVFITDFDCGVYPGPANAPAVLIESGTNGTPSGVFFTNGIVQGGTNAISVSAGTNVKFEATSIKRAQASGALISGGTVSFVNCVWSSNNHGGGAAAYDLEITQSSGNTYVHNSQFTTIVAATTVDCVTNPVFDTNHRGYFINDYFQGTNTTPSNVFGSTPQIVRGCVGYNPRGPVTAGTIGASPSTQNSSQNDITVYFTAINGMTAFSIGGQSIGLPLANVGYRVPARQAMVVTWATTAPTWIWLAD